MGLSFEVNFTNQTSLHGPKKMWIIQPEGGDQMFVCEIQQPLNLPAHKQPRHLEELFRSVKMWNRMNNNRIEKTTHLPITLLLNEPAVQAVSRVEPLWKPAIPINSNHGISLVR